MATARKVLVDPLLRPFYHWILRCDRWSFRCGEENVHWKLGIEDRRTDQDGVFAIDVSGVPILDNYLHLLLRLYVARS